MRKGWRGENALWEKREKRENEDGECVEAWRLFRSKIPRMQVRAGGNLLYLLYWDAGAGVLGVQCAEGCEGCEGCRGIWGCNAVKERKRHSKFFFNQGQTWK